MSTKTKEQQYDEEIAPQLMALAKRCQELGMPFIAQVEWEPGETGKTESHPPWNVDGLPSAKQKLVHYASRCNGNIDSMLMAVIREAKKNGHSSMYLKLLGCDNVVDTGGTAAFTIKSPTHET